MRLALVLSLTALFAGYLALLVLRQKLRDRATQKRFIALQLHHLIPPWEPVDLPINPLIAAITGAAHSQERYNSLARLIRERAGK